MASPLLPLSVIDTAVIDKSKPNKYHCFSCENFSIWIINIWSDLPIYASGFPVAAWIALEQASSVKKNI